MQATSAGLKKETKCVTRAAKTASGEGGKDNRDGGDAQANGGTEEPVMTAQRS